MLERNFSPQRRTLLGPLFKTILLDGRSVDDNRNFPKAAGVITTIQNIRRDLRVWDHLSEVRDAFPEIQIVERESPVKVARLVCVKNAILEFLF